MLQHCRVTAQSLQLGAGTLEIRHVGVSWVEGPDWGKTQQTHLSFKGKDGFGATPFGLSSPHCILAPTGQTVELRAWVL